MNPFVDNRNVGRGERGRSRSQGVELLHGIICSPMQTTGKKVAELV